jgi:hypothetical protein
MRKTHQWPNVPGGAVEPGHSPHSHGTYRMSGVEGAGEVEVQPWPPFDGHRVVAINANACLTVEQARHLAAVLLSAADRAENGGIP